MNFNEYQSAAMRTAPEQSQLDGLVHAGEGLTSEVGEYWKPLKRMHQYKVPMTDEIHANMCEELGDILWYVALACEHLGVSMHSLARANIAKLEARFPSQKFDATDAEARADKGGEKA